MRRYFGTILLLLAALGLLVGCGAEKLVEEALDMEYYALSDGGADSAPEEEPVEEGPAVRDPSLFYVKCVESAMCEEYYICYASDDQEVVCLGLEKTPFYIFGDRIYYTDGQLRSVDFYGENGAEMRFAEGEMVLVERISRVEDGWLYCLTDGPGPDEEKCWQVKADFSEYHRIDPAEAA